MNRTLRVIAAVLFIAIIMFSAISICQTIGRSMRLDVTEDKRNTLSEGTKEILAKIDQPITIKLYYSRTVALKAPDWIQALSNHYLFVRSLLQEYEAMSNGMIKLEFIDPRQYSQDETDAEDRYGLEGFPLPGPEKGETEKFFFGLVVETQFGNVEKIPFMAPNRQNLVEYEITRAIDTAITPAKKKIGILSSLAVTGGDQYQAYMMRRQPQPPWLLMRFLEQQYEVVKVDPKTDKIADDIDMLLIIHPKKLEDKTLLAIDQFVLSGKKTLVFIDPYAEADQPQQPQQPMMMPPQGPRNSDLEPLLKTWGLEMPQDTYAADPTLAGLRAWWKQGRMMRASRDEDEQPITYLNLEGSCLNDKCAITAYLNDFRMYFSGVLKEVPGRSKDIELIPLLSTTKEGSTIHADSSQVQNQFQWADLDKDFLKGTKPVHMGYLLRGEFKTAFPKGIEIKSESEDKNSSEGNEEKTETKPAKKMPQLTEGKDCAVVVVADVDCIYDLNLIRRNNYGQYALTENISFLQNALEFLSGSEALIQIRNRGGTRRFTKVDKIEKQAKEETEKEENRIRKQLEEIEKKRSESVQLKLDQAGGLSLQLDSEKLQQAEQERNQKYLELERELRDTMNSRREKIEHLGTRVKLVNLITAPGIILIIAIVLGIYRNVKRRRYISHGSDA